MKHEFIISNNRVSLSLTHKMEVWKKLDDVLINGYLHLKHVITFNSSKFCSTRLI